MSDQTPQAQRLRGYRIAAHASDVGVAAAAGQDAQHQRAQHVAFAARVGAAVAQRAAFDSTVEDAGRGQEFGEEHHWPCGVACDVSSQGTCMRPPIVWATITSSLACARTVFFVWLDSPIW